MTLQYMVAAALSFAVWFDGHSVGGALVAMFGVLLVMDFFS